jgi:phospholipid/cholesterol/gamma-HCH transport system substrate-binding protein
VIARVVAVGALGVAVVVLAVLLLTSGSSYTLRINLQDAGGLVAGNQVMIGPANVGSVNSTSLTPNGLAQIQIALDPSAAPVHQGTVARVYENSLSGIANRYVVLEPGPRAAPILRSGSLIGQDQSYSFVSLDQLFNTFTPATRQGFRNFIRGEAAAIVGRAPQAHQTLQYFAPALSTTSDVTSALTRSEPAFDALLVQGAHAMQQLASRSQQLTQLVANGNAATGAIASQSQALERALSLFPSTLTRSTTTFRGLNSTLDALTPLVEKAKPAVRRLAPFAAGLRSLATASIPTVAELNSLIGTASGGGGGLLKLLHETPSLARVGLNTFPRLIQQMNRSQAQLDYLREYAPDLVAALTNLGQAAGYYDSNGHYTRTLPTFFPFKLDSMNQLQSRPANERYDGLQIVHRRCPGSAVQPTPDGSAPWKVPGCSKSDVPPGP